jgi:hypothetical protein
MCMYIFYYSFMWVCLSVHPPLFFWGGGLTLMHSTEAANPFAKLTGSMQGWIQPSPVVDSITVVGILQPVSAASCYHYTTKC